MLHKRHLALDTKHNIQIQQIDNKPKLDITKHKTQHITDYHAKKRHTPNNTTQHKFTLIH